MQKNSPTTKSNHKKPLAYDPRDEVVRAVNVPRVVGLSAVTVWRLRTAEGSDFPRTIKLGTHAIGFRRRDLEAWLDKRSGR